MNIGLFMTMTIHIRLWL